MTADSFDRRASDEPEGSTLDQIRSEFSASLRSGLQPEIEAYLRRYRDVQRDELLTQLLQIEFDSLGKDVDESTLRELYERFPDDRVAIESAVRAVDVSRRSSGARMLAETQAWDGAEGSTEREAVPRAVAPSPRLFGEYELLDRIAQGGMGVVYRARHRRLNRIVALKMILSGQMAGEDQVQRFYAEAEAAAALDHPSIVPVFEVGQHQQQHFLSMAYVEGESLAAQLESGPLQPRRAAELLKQIAEAVDYAHQRGIIHRDLKPGNILLDAEGQPRITDFGLAKRIEQEAELTASGQVLGTPSFMPPEQALGQTKAVGPVSDVYALGAVLYSLLVGRPPFRASSVAETLKQVLEQEPVPPSRLNREIPQDLETICLKCLEKDQALRYQRASEVADELQRFLEGREIAARPISSPAKLLKWCRRNPVLAGSGLTVASVLFAATIVSLIFAWRANVSEQEARSASAELATQVVVANDAKQEALNALSKAEQQAYRNLLMLASEALAGRRVEDARTYLQQCPPQQRNLEWAILFHSLSNALTETELKKKVQFSITGDRIYAFGGDRGQRLVCRERVGRGERFSIDPGENQSFEDFTLSSGGQKLIALDGDGISIFDADQGTLLTRVESPFLSAESTPFSIAPSHEADKFYLYGKGIAVFDIKSEAVTVLLDSARSPYYKHLAASPNGRQLALVRTMRLLRLQDAHGNVDWAELGGLLQIGELGPSGLTTKETDLLQSPITTVASAMFLHEGNTLVAAGMGGIMTVDAATLRPMAYVHSEHTYQYCKRILQPNALGVMAERILAVRDDGVLEIWASHGDHFGKIQDFGILAVRDLGAIVHADYHATANEYLGCTALGTYRLTDGLPLATGLSESGRSAPAWHDDADFWSRELTVKSTIVTRLSIDPPSKQTWTLDRRLILDYKFAIATRAQAVAYVDPFEENRLLVVRLGEDNQENKVLVDWSAPSEIRSLAIDRQGRRLAVARKGILQVFSIGEGKLDPLWELEEPATELLFSDDGSQLASQIHVPLSDARNHYTAIWDSASGRELKRLEDEWRVVQFGSGKQQPSIFAGRSGFRLEQEGESWEIPIDQEIDDADFHVTGDETRLIAYQGEAEPPCLRIWDLSDGALLLTSTHLIPDASISIDGAVSVTEDGRFLILSLGENKTLWLDLTKRTIDDSTRVASADPNNLDEKLADDYSKVVESAIAESQFELPGTSDTPGSSQPDYRVKQPAPGLLQWQDEAGNLYRADTVTSRGTGMTCRYTADGAMVVTTDSSGCIRLWDAATGELRRRWIGGASASTGIGVSSAEHETPNRLLTCDADGLVREWSLDEGRPVHEHSLISIDALPVREIRCRDVTWHPTERLFATFIPAQGYRVWDADRMIPIIKINDMRDEMVRLAWSPEGLRLAAVGHRYLSVWNVLSQRNELRVPLNGTVIRASVAWSPDGKAIAVCEGSNVGIWDASSGKRLAERFLPNKASPTAVAWSPDGRLLAAGCHQTIVIWNLDETEEPSVQPVAGNVVDLAFSPDGTSLVKTGNLSIEAYDLASKQQRWSQPVLPSTTAVAWLNQGDTLVAASPDGMHFIAMKERMQPFASFPRYVRALAANLAHDRVAVAFGGPGIVILDAAANQQTILDPKTPYRLLAWNDSEQRLAGCTTDQTIRVWDLASGQQIAESKPPGYIHGLHWLPGGRGLLAYQSGERPGPLFLWDAKAGTRFSKLSDDLGAAANLSNDGEILVNSRSGFRLFSVDRFLKQGEPDARYSLKYVSDLNGSLVVDDQQQQAVGYQRQDGSLIFVDLQTNAQTLWRGIGGVDVAWRPSQTLAVARADRAFEFYDRQGNRKGFWLPLTNGQYIAVSPHDGSLHLSQDAEESLFSVRIDEGGLQESVPLSLPERPLFGAEKGEGDNF